MRLYKNERDGIWIVELSRGKRRSLKTRDEDIAKLRYQKLYVSLKTEELERIKGQTPIPTLEAFNIRYEKSRMDHPKSTRRADSLSFRKAMAKFGKTRKLDNIASEEVDNWIAEMIKAGRKRGAINVWMRHLKAAFNTFKKWEGLTLVNPFEGKVKKVTDARSPIVVKPEILSSVLLKIDDDEFRRMIMVYVCTGMRRGEGVGLAWGDVGDTIITVNGKTGKRYIPITNGVATLLGKRKKDDDYVFPRWRNPDTVTRMFHEAAKKAGYPQLHLHSLRHTYATRLAELRYPEAVRMPLLGHVTKEMAALYSHIANDSLRKASEDVDMSYVYVKPLDPAPQLHHKARKALPCADRDKDS